MSVHSRFLVKAAAAGVLLCCLWFVPSAKANAPYAEHQAPADGAPRGTSQLLPASGAGPHH